MVPSRTLKQHFPTFSRGSLYHSLPPHTQLKQQQFFYNCKTFLELITLNSGNNIIIKFEKLFHIHKVDNCTKNRIQKTLKEAMNYLKVESKCLTIKRNILYVLSRGYHQEDSSISPFNQVLSFVQYGKTMLGAAVSSLVFF